MEWIKRFFAPPVFEDDYERRRGTIINNLLLIVIMGGLIILLAAIFAADSKGILLLSSLVSIAIGMWIVLKRGNLIIPGIVLPLAILVGITLLIWSGNGLRDEVMLAYPLVIALGSFMVGGRSPLWFTLAVNAAISYTAIGEMTGRLTHSMSSQTDWYDFIIYNILIALMGALLHVLVTSFSRNLDFARENEQEVLASNRELATIRRNLEVRVAERTRDLTLSAEIGRFVAQERNLDFLLPNAVERIRETFALYYAQIYLADPAERTLNLRAGSGAIGQELLRRGHRLPVAAGSINGSAAYTKKSVLVEDTAKSKSFLPNALLPKTRSEMAVPLLSGTRVLGVLNMQSEYPETFTQETLPAYEILAGQLAAAIENAYQFAEIERASAQVEAQSRLLTRAGWDTYLDAVHQPEYLGFAYQNGETETLSAPTFQTGNQVAIPISIAGAEIGSIQLDTEGRSLSPEDQELATRLAVLAGQHIENLRLLTEAERFRREAEISARRLTREGWDTYQQTTDEKTEGYIYTQNRVKPMKPGGGDAHETGYVHPLTLRDEPVGNLEFALPEDMDGLDDETLELISTVAETLTAHMENLRLKHATETALGQSETLYEITTQLTKSQTLEEVLEAVASLRKDTRCSLLTIEVDAKGLPEWLTIVSAWPGGPSQIPLRTRFPIKNFTVSELWINQPDRATLSGNLETDPRIDAQTRAISQLSGIKASAYLPLKAGNVWVGLIALTWDTPQTFTHADAQLFDAVTAQSAVVVNNRLLFEATTQRAERESLINTINQRIQGATSVDSALETAAREIGHLLKARRAVVEIGTTPTNGQ